MSLASVDQLSDEETLELSPSAGLKEEERAKNRKTPPKSKSEPKPPKTPKAKSESSKPSKTPKTKSEPKKKPEPKEKAEPKSKAKGGPKKRPAAAVASSDAPAEDMKKPAGRSIKDPDHVSAGKSKYKHNGVWCIKLRGKEVVRAF